MKKYIILLTLLGTSFYTVNSQILISLLLGDKLNSDKIEFGLDGGFNYSTLSSIDAGSYTSDYFLGFYFDFKMKNPDWIIHSGVLVKSSTGASEIPHYPLDNDEINEILEGSTYTKKINYFYVPITMKYRFLTYFNVEGGIQLGLRTSANDTYEYAPPEGGDLTYRLNAKDQIKRLDAGLVAGLGSKLSKAAKSMQCGVKYYYGVVDIAQNNTGAGVYNSSIYLYCSIPIGVKKAEKAKQKQQSL